MSSGVGCRCLSYGAATTFVVSNAGEYSTDAVTVPVCEFDVVAGSDCAWATTKDGSVHTDPDVGTFKIRRDHEHSNHGGEKISHQLPSMVCEGRPDRSWMWTFRG